MNVEKANYSVIMQFGNLNMLKEKMTICQNTIHEIKDLCDDSGLSLLQKSLAFRKFDIAQYLLDNDVIVNHISNESCNELHYISANINNDQALSITRRLIDNGVDLNLKDKKYGNTPFWYFCQEALKCNSDKIYDLIKFCLNKAPKLDIENKVGYTIRKMLYERNNKILISMIEKGDAR